ncbi:MAG: hypothetical protein JXO48_00860 [Deltaproteobacteria bacterium]|nr:hypothetical protein [Deltaproteobacteria bacterium]
MKKIISVISVIVILLPLAGGAFGAETVIFGPKPYSCKRPMVFFRDSFAAVPGPGTLIIRNGSGNGDQVLLAFIKLNGTRVAPFILPQGETMIPVVLKEDNTLSLHLVGARGSFLTITITRDIGPPAVSIAADPPSIEKGASSTLTWTATNADHCILEPGLGTVAPSGSCDISPADTTTFIITAVGPGGRASASVTVEVTSPAADPPGVELTSSNSVIMLGEPVTLTWTSVRELNAYMDNGIGPVPVNGFIIVTPEHTTTYTLTVSGNAGSTSVGTTIEVHAMPEPAPEGSYQEHYEELIPADVTVPRYDARRFAVITGFVRSPDELPIRDVAITIHDHPEYGTARTNEEGRFSLPVEGGGTLNVEYRGEGLIPTQRSCTVPWNDIAVVETVTMIAEDVLSTTVTFDNDPATVTVHESMPTADEFGKRSCSLVFTGDNRAILVGEDGKDAHELPAITVRATEFSTEGSMPAKLPPTSAYTYCVELSVDGAARVRFEKPVITWVDNFIGFDVGEIVPVGYYDRDRGVWVPSDNGIVVKLLDTDADGVVDALDADGDGDPDDFNNSGSYNDEVTGLQDPGRYLPDATFWRVPVTHFSPWDCNWPSGPPPDAIPPNPEGVPNVDEKKTDKRDCTSVISSSVEERSRVFHEDIPIPGTDMTLHYASSRVKGYMTEITVPVSGETIPASLKRIEVTLTIAGRTYTQTVEPLPMQSVTFEWDGLDYRGTPVNRSIQARMETGFVYDRYYFASNRELEQAFGQAGAELLSVIARMEETLWKTDTLIIQGFDGFTGTIAEGWTVSSHHRMDPERPYIIHKGDGGICIHKASIIETEAGTGVAGYSGDGNPAAEARLGVPHGIAMDASGNLYIADESYSCVRRVDMAGMITTVAGTGELGYSGDGGPATEAKLGFLGGIAVDMSGSLYIADWDNNCIRKIDTSGIITTVAGTGESGYSGDGGPATEARLNFPDGIAVDQSGNLYIADFYNSRVRKVDTSGTITTVAGTGQFGYSGDGGAATEAELNFPRGVAVDSSGNLLITDEANHCVRRVDTSGIITTIAGTGKSGYSGDGGPATEARLFFPYGIAVDASGGILIADWSYSASCIRRVDTTGIITTIAGTGESGYSGDGGPATEARLFFPYGVAVNTLGGILIADSHNHRIRKMGIPVSFNHYAADSDIVFVDINGCAYIMSPSGYHKRTIDTATGVTLLEFGYDDDNNLVSIIDRFGAITVIQQSGGKPGAIISPDGLTTILTIDGTDHLTRITYPDGTSYDFEYTTEGLLTAKTEPEGNRYEHVFDERGRLTDATDEEGGHWSYERFSSPKGDIETTVVTGEGNLTTYLDHTFSTGRYTSTISDPTGGITLYESFADGFFVTKSLPCGMTLEFQYGVDPEYQLKYIKELWECTPSFLERQTLTNRTYEDTDSDNIPDLITEAVTFNGRTTICENDVLNARKTITSPEGRTVTALYDPATLLTTSITVPGLFDRTCEYDARGRVTSITIHNRTTELTYDIRGFLASVTDPGNHTITYSHDPLGRVTGISRPDGGSLGFIYDQNGNVEVLITPSNDDHVFGHNSVNRKDFYQTPISGSYRYVYDKDRRLTQTHFPSGAQITNIYDKTRLIRVETPEGNIDLSYLCGTKVDSITNGTDTITYGYDGRLVTTETMTGILNETLSYTYNNDFAPITFAFAGGARDYNYDNDGLLTGAGAFTITRNAGNGLPEGVTGGTFALDRAFNGYGEVDGEDVTIHDGIIASWGLTRDDNGRITARTETAGGITSGNTYTYDSTGRLLMVTRDGTLVEEYRYDPNGTRIYEMNTRRGIAERGFTYSDEEHLLTAGTATYRYTLDGFLMTKTEGAEETRYDYSSRGDLLGVILPDGTAIDYLHDPLGRRIAKKVNGTITEKYLWHGLTRLLAVYDGNNDLRMRFEYADSPMPSAMNRGGNTYYLIYDQVGSLKIVADASGTVIKAIDYDSFGNIISDSNPAFEIPFGFAGGLHDRDTKLVRFGYRDYDPDTGRWTTKDPILFAGGDTDLYGYCLNDPVNALDPEGLWGVRIGGSLMGADISTMIYDSNKGWFPSTKPDTGVSTTAFGGGVHITFDDPCGLSSYNDSDLMVSCGLGKYLGFSYSPDFAHKSINLGLSLGLPTSFSTSCENFATSVGKGIEKAFH